MRRKVAALLTALALCCSLSVTALAAETEDQIDIRTDIGADTYVDGQNLATQVYNDSERIGSGTLEGYVAVRDDTVITVSNTGTADDGSYLQIYVSYYFNEDGTYTRYDSPHRYYLTPGGFLDDILDPTEMGGLVELRAGQSTQFTLPTEQFAGKNDDILYLLEVERYTAEWELAASSSVYYYVDPAAVEAAAAEEPEEPETPAAPSFTDVAESDYYYAPVQWAVENGVTTGTTDTTFSPASTCTTAQILTFLWRAVGEPAPAGENPFSDVAEDVYYADAAAWAHEQGLVSGETFNGDAPCTRSAVVTYLWKLADEPEAEAAAFTDVAADADYAQAVAWAVSEGVTTGTSDTTFSPDSTCTRGQIVTFLYRDLAENAA